MGGKAFGGRSALLLERLEKLICRASLAMPESVSVDEVVESVDSVAERVCRCSGGVGGLA